MKHLRKLKLEDNPGLKEDNSKDYLKLLQLIEGIFRFTQQKAKEYKSKMTDAAFTDNICNLKKYENKYHESLGYNK